MTIGTSLPKLFWVDGGSAIHSVSVAIGGESPLSESNSLLPNWWYNSLLPNWWYTRFIIVHVGRLMGTTDTDSVH